MTTTDVIYGVLPLLLYAAVTYAAARYLHPLWIPVAQILIGVAVVYQDTQWIHAQEQQHKWNATEDEPVGVFGIVLVNTVLLPFAAAGVIIQTRNMPSEVIDEIHGDSTESFLKRHPRRHPWVG